MPPKRTTNARRTTSRTTANATSRKTTANATARRTTSNATANARKALSNSKITRMSNNNSANQIRLIEELEQKHLPDSNGIMIFHKTNRSTITVKMVRHHIYYTGVGAKNTHIHTPDEFKEIMLEHFENHVKNKSLDEMVEWSGACYGKC